MRAVQRFGWVVGFLPLVAVAATPPRGGKPPKDAPFCAPPGARQIFVAPMGQVFRATAGQPYPSAAWFAAADRDGNGVLDQTEMMADARGFFRQLDGNGDGRLTPEEIGSYERMVAPEIALFAPHGAAGGRAAATGYGGPLGAGRFAWLNIPEPVAAADADIDRVVTAAEFADAANRRFATLDATHAGGLRLAAMPRTPQQVAIEGPCRPPKPRRHPRGDELDDPDPTPGQEMPPR